MQLQASGRVASPLVACLGLGLRAVLVLRQVKGGPCIQPPLLRPVPPRSLQALLHPNSTQVRRASANSTISYIRPGNLREQLAQSDNSTMAAGDVALLLLDAPVDGALPVALATTEQWDGELRTGALVADSQRAVHAGGRGEGLQRGFRCSCLLVARHPHTISSAWAERFQFGLGVRA